MTKRQLCELVQRNLAGGTPSAGFEPKIEEIALYINPAIAVAAKKNYVDGINLDGIEYVSGAFVSKFKNKTLTYDESEDAYYTALPAQPASLPDGYSVSNIQLFEPVSKKRKNTWFVTSQSRGYFANIPHPQSAVFSWIEDGKIYFYSEVADLGPFKAMFSMVTPSKDGSLDSDIGVPEDYIIEISAMLEAKYRPTVLGPKDNSNDGKNNPQ